MVAEQRETVQRIDADTVDIASNVSGAQRELLKYYASISSNRWLMLKVFGVLIVFVRLPRTLRDIYTDFIPATVLNIHPGILKHDRFMSDSPRPFVYKIWTCAEYDSLLDSNIP